MAVQEQPQQEMWQPTYNPEQTKRLVKTYQASPGRFKEDQLEQIRQHAQYHNISFYEGDFSVMQAIQQAGSGLIEGFSTLRTGEHPDNEYEAIARNIGHLVGFVPGILSAPLRALGVMTKSTKLLRAAQGVSAIKSGPMKVADIVTKQAKKMVKPIISGAADSRFKAADAASKFLLKNKGEVAKHMVEGAFHLGTASAVSSVWDGVDQMWESFKGGAKAGFVFRGIGNVIPGTKSGDKVIKGIAGAMFMGLPHTMRGATNAEQIYEYLAGAYFGANETNWIGASKAKTLKEFNKQAQKDAKLEFERNPEEMEGWDNVHPLVQKVVKKQMIKDYGTPQEMQRGAFELMKKLGVTDKIPEEEWTTKGYDILSNVRKGMQKRSRKKTHEVFGVMASGGAKGSDSYWSMMLEKVGVPVIHFMPETPRTKKNMTDYFNRKKKGLVTGVDRGLSEAELMEAGPALERANRTLQRQDVSDLKNPNTYDYLARNWYQIKDANGIYAIGELEYGGTGNKSNLNGRTVKGGAGWSVQMGIDKGMRNINVFDPKQNRWFKWSNVKNRFEKIDEAPRLVRNSAVIGTRGDIRGKSSGGIFTQKLSAESKQAIKDVVEKTFGDKILKKVKDPDAKPIAKVGGHSKTAENIKNLKSEIVTLEKELDDIVLDLKEGKIARTQMKNVKARQKEIVGLIKDYNENIAKQRQLSKTEYSTDMWLTEDNIVNDIDIGTSIQASSLMRKSEAFSNEHLKEVWDIDGDALVSKRDNMLRAGKVAEESIRLHTEIGEKNVRWEDAVINIEKELKLKKNLNEDAQRVIKKWLTEQNLGKEVIFVKTNQKAVTFTDPRRPTSSSGKSLRQVEPPKLIEEIYIAEGGKQGKGVPAPLVVLDTVFLRHKNGYSVDVPLNKLVNHFRFNASSTKMKEADAIAAANRVKSKIIKEMAEKHNMYPMGGQGDKGRINFVKFHPKGRKNVKKDYLDVVRNLRKVDKKALTLLSKDMREAKGMGISNEAFKKMVVSNMMYDLNLNGFTYTPQNIQKVIGKGFIPSAIQYNKRAQIWMTNGYSGNKEFIKNQIDDLSPNGNFNYVLIGDPSLPKGLSSLKAMNVELPEHVDGAILVRQGVIDAINYDAAHPKSGQNKSFIIDNTPFKGTNMGALLGKYMMHTVGKEASAEMRKKGLHFMIMTSSAKQIGSRKVGNYEVKESKLKVIKSSNEIEKEWENYVDTPNLTDPRELGSKLIIRRNSEFVKKDKSGNKIDYFEPIRSKIQWAAFQDNITYNETTGKFTPLTQKTGGGLDIGKTPIYELDPGSIKYNSSVINDSHMAQKQIWVKQLFTNLHQFGHSPISDKMIEDIHKETMQKAFDGNKEANQKLKDYQATLDNSKVEDLVRNLEDYGTNELISALKTPGAERFAEMAMQKMLRIVEKDIEHSFQEGEISAEKRGEAISNIRDSVSPIDRLLKNVAIVGEEAAKKGKAGFSGYMHKHVKDYKAAVLHNYFVKSIVRPKADNSAVARIRPYDKWMQKDFKELNKKDDIFYLDEAYKDTKIKLSDGTTKTLGQLWASKDPAHKDVFNALVLRVPMDSISGAHKLEFKGFTGREGHGIMMHGRSMRALGGADLDGDEAFVYFGGKNADGKGYGMKQSWIDAIHANKGEFYKKGDVMDNKKDFRELLTEGAGKDNPMKSSKALYYSPVSRLKASEGAVSGRDALGTIVSQAQTMRSAYNSIMGSNTKKDVFYVRAGDDMLKITLRPRESAKDRRYQRELTRAQIAFGSDPLDEAGLKHPDVFFNTMHDAYFTKEVQIQKKMKGKYLKFDKGLSPWMLKKGVLASLRDMNSAYFSKNFEAGRRYTMDEVNEKASAIRNFTENEKNTMLPKLVDTLEGLDWSDNLFNRLDAKITKKAYDEVNEMVEKFEWLKPLMARASFKVPYTEQIDMVLKNNLQNRHVRRALSQDDSISGLKNMIKIINKTPWKKEIEGVNRKKFLYDAQYRLNLLHDIVRQSEDFMSNDLADMATMLNVKRILGKNRISPKKIKEIHARTETFKKRSYLSRIERKDLDTGSFLEDVQSTKDRKLTDKVFEVLNEIEGKPKSTKKVDLKADKRSATWDQMQLDAKIFEYKAKLSKAEKELFDHLMIGTLNRGRIDLVYKFLNQLKKDQYNPMLRSVVSKLIQEASGTKQSRLAINSEAIENSAIQNHFRAMNDVYGKMWEQPTKETIEKKSKEVEVEVEKAGIGKDKTILDDLVQGAHKGEGYAGIKEGELNSSDKKVITEIATILKRYNNKVGEDLPDLNEQIRGILYEATGKGKDLNALHRQDFMAIRNWLREAENGTMFQNIWRNANPEIQARYYSLFPKTTNRELMKYDIKWLSKEGWFQTADGTMKKGIIKRPTYFLEILQNWIGKSNSLAQSKAEVMSKEIENDFLHLEEFKEGNGLFKIAVAQRESGIKRTIGQALKRGDITEGEAQSYKITYDNLKSKTEKKFDWKKLKDKSFTTTNDNGKRVTITGSEMINGSEANSLTGINQKLTKRFESMHKLIRGDEKIFKMYQTGKYFDPVTKTQPIMNWKKFIKDAETSFERGDELGMELGIDGMRHVMRSMMYDLGAKGNNYNKWVFKPTGKFDFKTYWPHMFFDKAAANKSMHRALEKIQRDPNLNKEEKLKALQEVTMRHKSLTGEWMFGDMGDWEKTDVFEMQDALSGIASGKKNAKENIKWSDMKVSTGSLFNRKGHVEGWSTDMGVLDAYVKNVTSTYYRQLNQIVGRNTIAEAKKRMTKKFGYELATRWENFFKLYVQGAMGQPDVIPDYIYNDPKMKIQGTPYAWFADNKVLNRVNSIREKLGIRESDLPKELKDFTYQDIRAWSNMEAKFELAALLAHPKSAITNVFGGSLHTIQSAGPNALIKARSIKFLKRINPAWKTMEDIDAFVVKKGVIPEFMIHELGLGSQVKDMKGIKDFVADLSTKIHSKDAISRKEIFKLGKKYNIGDKATALAGKFMSIPERMLRRDAFMAHYIQAWERYGGTINDPNHPFLIEMAKKGVKATQFLYEAPYRPFFARTSLGKVMTRFQLYAWNSVRFRNDVTREAARYGFKPGTESYDKFKRTMEIDLFVSALGAAFMYSLFDTAMPQPYSWMQDTANWLFGSEKERDRAFYGTYPSAIAPLQVISPPIARIPMSAIMAYAKGDWDKLTDYQIYTMFPFGRIARDIGQPGRGLIDNPSRLPEKLMGLPLQDLTRKKAANVKAKEEGTRYKQPKPGIY